MELPKNKNDSASDRVESCQSDFYVRPLNRTRQKNLRSTQSSPHRSVELHHTKSLSEIVHLHPSHTDLSSIATNAPKLRAIEELQHEIRRPESVLEISEMPTTSDEESDVDAIETQQEKGDEAMKIFLESNVNVPLDGNMTSSSVSQDTIDSDIASESELIVGNWKREKIDSIVSSSSSAEKRFLTPSGILLYREQQVDSMLDTKRVHRSSSSSERPMSPLAVRKSKESLNDNSMNSKVYKDDHEGYKKDNARDEDDTDSDSDTDDDDVISVRGEKIPRKDFVSNSGLQDLGQLVRKYEKQYEQLINRSKQQHDRINTLQKDNVNMHREHNRLQGLIRECYKYEHGLKRKAAEISEEKEKVISQLGQQVKDLRRKLQEKICENSDLQESAEYYQMQVNKYDDIMKQLMTEAIAMFDTFSKESQSKEILEYDAETNPDELVGLLKSRRQSLSDELKHGYDEKRPPNDFQITMSKKQCAKRGFLLKRSASLDTLLTLKKRYYGKLDEHSLLFLRNEMDVQPKDLEKKNDQLMKDNAALRKKCSKWKQQFEHLKERYAKRSAASDVKRKYEQVLPSTELRRLQKIIQHRRKSHSESSINTLQLWRKQNTYIIEQNKRRHTLSVFNRDDLEPEMSIETVSSVENFTTLKNNSDVKTSTNALEKDEETVGHQELSDLEQRLKQLSKITENMSETIVKNSQSVRSMTKVTGGENLVKLLSGIYGEKLFSIIKEIYDEHLRVMQNNIESRERECRLSKEQLLQKDHKIEMMEYHFKSLKRELYLSQKELRNYENTNETLESEIQSLKDKMLVQKTEHEMVKFYHENHEKRNYRPSNENFYIKQQDDWDLF